jgi:cytochrome c-type biogenesis protein CcmE
MTENEGEPIDDEVREDITSPPTPQEKDEMPQKKKKRFIATRKGKLVIVILFICIVVIIVLWGAAPGDYKTLEEVMENSNSYLGKEVEMIGKVGNWTGGQNFTLVGRSDENITLFVIHEKEIPDGFSIGKDVVVQGKLVEIDGTLTFKSNHPIQVGCPSKY